MTKLRLPIPIDIVLRKNSTHEDHEHCEHLERSERPERADKLILAALSHLSESDGIPSPLTRTQLQRLIEEGHVTIDGIPIKANSKLKAGTRVQILIPPPQATELTPEDRPIEILYQDEHLAIINKPAGLTVHPSPTQMENTLVHALLHHLKDLSGIGGVLRPGIVHRLDKNTSGALVVSKTDQAHTRLVETFSKHEIDRVYWALCYGAIKDQKLKVESLIGRSTQDRKKMSMKVSRGRHAVTYLKKLEEFSHLNKTAFASWVEATLETGRTHQVRVHLTGQGHSLLGDPTYGKPSATHSKWTSLPKEIQPLVEALPGQALHARVLGFHHPITGKKLYFEATPPVHFQQLLDGLEKYRKT